MIRRLSREPAALVGVLAGVVLLLIAQAYWLPGPAAPADELHVVRAARAGAAAVAAPLTSLALAPFWHWWGAVPAYRATKVLESVVFALTVVPAYLLARPLVGRSWAIAAAAAAVLVPLEVSTSAASPVALAYPAASAALLAFTRYLEERRARPLLAALLGYLLAAALWPTLAPLGVTLGFAAVAVRPGARRFLRWPGAGVWIALAVAAYVVWSALVAASSAVAAATWGDSALAAARSVGAWALGLAVLAPIAAFGALRGTGTRPHTVTAAAVAVAMVPTAGVVAAGNGISADERPLVVLVPLVLPLALYAVLRRAPPGWGYAVGALVLLGAALTTQGGRARFDPAAPGLQWLRSGGIVTEATLVATVVLACAVAVALLLWAPAAVGAAPLAALVLVAPVPAAAVASSAAHHRARSERAALPEPPTFLERVDGDVAIDGGLSADVVDSLLFWNGNASVLDPPLADRSADPTTGVYQPLVTGLSAGLVSDPRQVRGVVLERTSVGSVVRLGDPAAAAETVTGVYPDGWSGPGVTYRRFSITPGASLTITLSRTAFTGPDVAGGVTVAVGGLDGPASVVRRLRVPSGASRTVRLRPPNRPFRVDLTLQTFSPSRYGSSDTRQIGVQPAFRYGR